MRWNRTTNPMFGKVALWCSLCLGLSTSAWQYSLAEEVRLLENDTNAIQARLQLIQEAEHEIVIACHDSDSGQVFTQLGNALADRAQQGVRVRLLMDGLVPKQSYDQLHDLSMRQVEVKIFHPLGTKSIRWLNRRLHSKIMVGDEDTMIMGSRNLTDANFGLACDNYVDADYLIRGDLCRCGKQYFDWLWNVEGTVDIRQAVQWQAHRKPEDTSDESYQRDCASGAHGPSEPTDAMGRCITPGAVDASFDVPSHSLALFYDRDVSKQNFSFEEQVLKCINSARCSLTIETPYPAFSHNFKLALIRAAKRGVRVTLMTNSISNSDQPTTVAALLNQKRAMLRAGIEIREYRGRGLIHAKNLIVDQTVAWVGSYNFDPRGDRLNLELCLRVTDPNLAKAIEDGTLRRNLRAQTVTMADLGRLDPEMPLKTRLQIRGFQLLMPALRPSL